ncbi:aminotransferase class V-fold PLP-dependent enzyme [Fibrella aquatilis]|uniref:Aminotransferase class V-fold PLP-dependent enzyme n=1 Tax=Fibrella aquatilis TaxID=2817059 RepID=A0A939JY41_9BACT|nr:aminotransferase class V-fold PLP-dependent enzyme [Fibrella aquatilis]MBO0931689.1 aminotransferase class V-fold PLP-dependent enzyme [Fibrella aquatilis]
MIAENNLLVCQRDQYPYPADAHYLNCATRAPLSRAVAQAGIDAVQRQLNPMGLVPDDFFSGGVLVRQLFAQLIDQPDPERIAIIPSISYGMAVVAQNLPRKPGFRKGQTIVLATGEFPSDVFAWDRVSKEQDLTIVTVDMPATLPAADAWNEAILARITSETALVVVPMIHWMYGTKFDLEAIGERCRDVGAWLAVDGTQSIGAMPFNWARIRPDALVCAGYKWLMGPYSLGVACFGPAFDGGIPLEEAWMNRLDSNQFHRLAEYQPAYRPGAYRYNMGEQSNFTQMPMLEASLRQLLDYQPERVQTYCQNLMADALPELESLGYRIEPASGRGHHLLGVWVPDHADPMAITKALLARNVSVSARARAIRISPHVYNSPEDVQALVEALK